MTNYYLYNPIYALILVFVFLTSCNGQEKANTAKGTNTSKPSPTVIKYFKAVAWAPDFDTTLVSQYIRSIFQDSKGNLWFGTLGEGVVRYDVKTLTYFSNPDGFNSSTVNAINEDKNGNLWFGTDQGAYKYDGKNFINYKEKSGLSSISVSRKSILVDKDGKIWVGTEGGVFQYNPVADTLGGKPFAQFPLLASIKVRGILEDKNRNIWFATEDMGVFRFDGKAVTNITAIEGLGNNYSGGIVEDKTGNIWFTMNGGICRYDGKSFTEFTTKDGLGGSEVWGIYLEKSGIIWITARGSQTRYDPSIPISNSNAFTVFTVADGINCCVQSMYQDRSENMWWGAGSGLYRFDGKRFYQVKQNGPW
ncbi:two-component regulator propeller domain-containing protein [Flavobacterium filum]|uniref:ligand-binding sensor domain-containing protein n=1 Tax=Flavobacterium filum TaxID=370974 RepID=UPI0023EFDC99|nr:two-component regulator propeller domain-containing protein [Flavobacterium filum]